MTPKGKGEVPNPSALPTANALRGAGLVNSVLNVDHQGAVGDPTGKAGDKRADAVLERLNNMKSSKVGVIEYDERGNPIHTEITDSDETVVSDVPVGWFEKYFPRKKDSQ